MIYNTSDILATNTGIKYYKAKRYPFIPPNETDLYIVTVQGDRLDLLAYDYYKDASLWKIIAIANSIPLGSIYPEPGTQLRIPTDLNNVMDLIIKENEV
jgi:hypothetical protein